MHEPVRQYVRDHMPPGYASVIEVGSLDINGGVRDLLHPEAEYVGVDVQAGPGVDVVEDFRLYEHPEPVDVVLCLEVLEHTPDCRDLLAAAARNLKPGGTLLLTCATTGRAPHSARSEGPIEPDEFYQNVMKAELDGVLAGLFAASHSEVVGTDLRAWAVTDSASKWSVIIPSRSDTKTLACVESLRSIQPAMHASQIVIVSDGLSKQTRKALGGVTWVKGKRPFVFAEAINAGAVAAGDADLLIVGDDVRFCTPGMVNRLRAQPEGAAAVAPSVIGVCGQSAQRHGEVAFVSGRSTSVSWLAFICVYIPRRAWDAIGPLDERFVGYGYDDTDWCLRSREYGPLLIDHGSVVNHIDASTYRSRPGWQTLYAQNKELFEQKWRGVVA